VLARRLVPLALTSLLAAASLAACTSVGGEETPTVTPNATSPTGGPVASDIGDVEFAPGEFQYAFNDITARLSMSGGTLEISNGSGAEVGAPSLSTVTIDDRTVDLTVEDAAPIPDGGEATFTVTFPDGIDQETVGLIVLTLGEDNYGALAPVPA
jgi:hypothetical protein